ncbi:MAG: glycosyltransferase [Vicinamibacterales bacterium]
MPRPVSSPVGRFVAASLEQLRVLGAEGWRASVDHARDRWRDSQWRVTLAPRRADDPLDAPVLNLAGVPAAARFGDVSRLLMARLRVEARERAVAVLAPDRTGLALDWWTSEARFGLRFAHPWAGEPAAPDPTWLAAVRRCLDLTRPRFVHVEDVTGLSLPSLVELAHAGPPMVLSVHDLAAVDAAPREPMRLLLDQAVAVVCPSAYVRGALRSWFPALDPARLVLIPPGLPPVSLDGPAGRDPRQVAVLGGLGDAAGGALAMDAAIELAGRGCEVTLHGGGGHDRLRALGGRGGIRVRGYSATGELPRLLAAARTAVALVLPAAPPSFSLELSDAWAAGVPVVATDTGALSERLAEGGGRLVPADASPEAVADVVDLVRAASPRVPRPPSDVDAAAAHTALYLACASRPGTPGVVPAPS